MASLKKQEKIRLQRLLWQNLLAKIDKDWPTKYAKEHGKNRLSVKHGTRLAYSICEDMIATAKAKNIAAPKVSNHLTLHGYLNNDGFPSGAKPVTLDKYARYLSFKNWKDFVDQHPADSSQQTTLKETPKQNTSRDGTNWWFIGPVILMAFGLGYMTNDALGNQDLINPVYNNDLPPPSLASYSFHDTISQDSMYRFMSQAMQMEFNSRAKRDLDQDDLNRLHEYFMKDGPAARKILAGLKSYQLKNAKIDLITSSVDVLDLEIIHQDSEFMTLTTKERWVLNFEDDATQADRVKDYEAINEQKYYLQITNKGPVVLVNIY